jgi:hypothetical protein
MSSSRTGFGGILVLALAAPAFAQQVPFQLLVTQNQSAVTIQNGGTITFSAPIGQSQAAQIKATYSGTGRAAVSQQPVVLGSTAFKATIPATLPLLLNPGDSFIFNVTFSPGSSVQNNAQLSLPFVENGSTTPSAILLSLQGSAPSFVLSYVLQTDQNVVPLQPGGTIPFPATLIGSTSQASLNLTNTGSGPGTVNSIALTGGAFRLQGLPLLPVAVPSGQSLQVFVLYQPTGVNADTGEVTITFATGSPVTINLQGNGSSASLTYQVLSTDPPTTVPAGGTIARPDTDVGQTASALIRVSNSGNASGTVTSISLAGQGFQLGSLPVLPQTLAPNASLTFTVTFAPTQPGALSATLVVNSDSLKLSGKGLGPSLTFSYVAAGTTITLGGANNSVFFSPVTISQSAQITLDVKNMGTLPATISNIGVGQTNSPFSLIGVPALPVSLAPNADFHITIQFTPAALGFANGTLLLDTMSIALVGSGTQPPSLPVYTITGPNGTASPMAQPTVGLSLSAPYPVAISGTLTLTASGNLPADPAVQFATGGRTVSFVVPANQTDAVFGAQGTQIGLQTGTVASALTLTPSFATQAGNVDLTPATPDALQLTVPPAAPTLIAIQLTNETATGFTIQATGFTTTRSLTTGNVQFTPASGFSMPNSQFTIDVKQVSTVWFQSAASQAFGGQFRMTIPFTFQGISSDQSVLNAIASVSVTMSNESGASNPIQATVR